MLSEIILNMIVEEIAAAPSTGVGNVASIPPSSNEPFKGKSDPKLTKVIRRKNNVFMECDMDVSKRS